MKLTVKHHGRTQDRGTHEAVLDAIVNGKARTQECGPDFLGRKRYLVGPLFEKMFTVRVE